MNIVNIVEIIDNVVHNLTSFGIVEEQLSGEVVEQAEELFTKVAVENGADAEDMNLYLEDGYYKNGDYTVCITWSEVAEG